MNSFASPVSEGFAQLFATAGDTWILSATNADFKGVELNEDGSYTLAMGETEFKDEIRLTCLKSDFPGAIPPRVETVVFRKAQPTILYKVLERTQAKNPINPTFIMTLALKGG